MRDTEVPRLHSDVVVAVRRFLGKLHYLLSGMIGIPIPRAEQERKAREAALRFLGKLPISYRSLLSAMVGVPISRAEQEKDTGDQLALIEYLEPYLAMSDPFSCDAALILDMLWWKLGIGYKLTHLKLRNIFSPRIFNRQELVAIRQDRRWMPRMGRMCFLILPLQGKGDGYPLICRVPMDRLPRWASVEYKLHRWALDAAGTGSVSWGLEPSGLDAHCQDHRCRLHGATSYQGGVMPMERYLNRMPVDSADIGSNFRYLRSSFLLQMSLRLIPTLRVLLNVQCRDLVEAVSADIAEAKELHQPMPHWQQYNPQIDAIVDNCRRLDKLRCIIENIVPAFKPEGLDVEFLVHKIFVPKVGVDGKVIVDAEGNLVWIEFGRIRIEILWGWLNEVLLDHDLMMAELKEALGWWSRWLEIGQFLNDPDNCALISAGWEEVRLAYDLPGLAAVELSPLTPQGCRLASPLLRTSQELWRQHLESRSQSDAPGGLSGLQDLDKLLCYRGIFRESAPRSRGLALRASQYENKQIVRTARIASLEVEALSFTLGLPPTEQQADAWPTLFHLSISPIPPERLPVQGLLGLVYPREMSWHFPTGQQLEELSTAWRSAHPAVQVPYSVIPHVPAPTPVLGSALDTTVTMAPESAAPHALASASASGSALAEPSALVSEAALAPSVAIDSAILSASVTETALVSSEAAAIAALPAPGEPPALALEHAPGFALEAASPPPSSPPPPTPQGSWASLYRTGNAALQLLVEVNDVVTGTNAVMFAVRAYCDNDMSLAVDAGLLGLRLAARWLVPGSRTILLATSAAPALKVCLTDHTTNQDWNSCAREVGIALGSAVVAEDLKDLHLLAKLAVGCLTVGLNSWSAHSNAQALSQSVEHWVTTRQIERAEAAKAQEVRLKIEQLQLQAEQLLQAERDEPMQDSGKADEVDGLVPASGSDPSSATWVVKDDVSTDMAGAVHDVE